MSRRQYLTQPATQMSFKLVWLGPVLGFRYGNQMQDIEKISKLVSKWEGAYVCAVQSYVGLKNSKQEPLLLHGKMVFKPWKSGTNLNDFLIETEHICAGRTVKMLGPKETASFIEKAAIGEMEGVGCLSPKPNNEQFSNYFNIDYHPLVGKLSITGNSRQNMQGYDGFPQYLDWEMKTGDVPFDSFDELLAYCGLPRWNLMRDDTKLELLFHPPGQIDKRSKIENGRGSIECRTAAALDVEKLKLGIRVFTADHNVARKSITGKHFEWRADNDCQIGICKIDVNDSPAMEAYLSYDGIPLDQRSVSDPQKLCNIRFAIHELFDPQGDRLPAMLLKPEGDKASVFECGVSTVFSLLGFTISNYGRFPKFQDGPDIIAVAPNGNVVVIECTLGTLNRKDKLEKLMQRTQSIREKLKEISHVTAEIQPVIVTALPKGEVAVGMEDARAHKIAVVCKENLEDAIRQVELPIDPNKFFDGLKELIPASENKFPFGLAPIVTE